MLSVLLWLLPAVSAFAQSSAEASRWHSHANLGVASDIVYRGIRLSDEDLVPDLQWELKHQGGFFASIGATQVDLEGLYFASHSEQWQLAYDLGYSWQLNRDWAISGSYTWLRYSDSDAAFNYDYEEWSAAVHYSDYASLVYATTDDLWGFETEQEVLSLVLRYPLSASIIGEVEGGRVENDPFYNSHYEYQFARVNLGYVYRHWSAQLQYHYSSSEAKKLYRNDRVGSQWVVKFAYHFSLL